MTNWALSPDEAARLNGGIMNPEQDIGRQKAIIEMLLTLVSALKEVTDSDTAIQIEKLLDTLYRKVSEN